MDLYFARELYELSVNGSQMELDQLEYVSVEGWVRTNRDNGQVGFIELNDGSYFRNIQIVYGPELENHAEVSHLLTGASILVIGKFISTPENKQPFEIRATSVEILGACEDTYPLQKKRHSFEFLREIPHLRPRTNTFMAVYRVRSVLAMAIHEFFQSQGFVYVHTPIITGNDAEGAGEVFTVTTRDDANYAEDFFGKHASLTVSGQLHVEAFAMAFRDVYTFGPTFRSENSNTKTHASEFWMIEPEMCFMDLDDCMGVAEGMLKYIISYVLDNAPEEMEFLNNFIDNGLIERLQNVVDNEFGRITYTDAIKILEEHNDEFTYKVSWGADIQTEHERFLTEKVFGKPIFVTDYPAAIKSFYMKQNEDGKTVRAMDCLVPGIGEIMGGSQREEDYDKLLRRMKELDMNMEDYDFYMDLRKFGTARHSGYGLGFERCVMYITGIGNIRDSIPFPRTFGNFVM